MIVKCTECHAAYSVDDSKVLNKKFGFTCPKCGTNVIMDNRPTRVLAEPDSNSVSIDNSGLDMPSGTDDFGDFFNVAARVAFLDNLLESACALVAHNSAVADRRIHHSGNNRYRISVVSVAFERNPDGRSVHKRSVAV